MSLGGSHIPAALASAMAAPHNQKPFTYLPGGLDMSQIRSPRMAKRAVIKGELNPPTTAPLPFGEAHMSRGSSVPRLAGACDPLAPACRSSQPATGVPPTLRKHRSITDLLTMPDHEVTRVAFRPPINPRPVCSSDLVSNGHDLPYTERAPLESHQIQDHRGPSHCLQYLDDPLRSPTPATSGCGQSQVPEPPPLPPPTCPPAPPMPQVGQLPARKPRSQAGGLVGKAHEELLLERALKRQHEQTKKDELLQWKKQEQEQLRQEPQPAVDSRSHGQRVPDPMPDPSIGMYHQPLLGTTAKLDRQPAGNGRSMMMLQPQSPSDSPADVRTCSQPPDRAKISDSRLCCGRTTPGAARPGDCAPEELDWWHLPAVALERMEVFEDPWVAPIQVDVTPLKMELRSFLANQQPFLVRPPRPPSASSKGRKGTMVGHRTLSPAPITDSKFGIPSHAPSEITADHIKALSASSQPPLVNPEVRESLPLHGVPNSLWKDVKTQESGGGGRIIPIQILGTSSKLNEDPKDVAPPKSPTLRKREIRIKVERSLPPPAAVTSPFTAPGSSCEMRTKPSAHGASASQSWSGMAAACPSSPSTCVPGGRPSANVQTSGLPFGFSSTTLPRSEEDQPGAIRLPLKEPLPSAAPGLPKVVRQRSLQDDDPSPDTKVHSFARRASEPPDGANVKQQRQLVMGEFAQFAGGRPSMIAGRRRPSQSPSMWLLGRTYIKSDDGLESNDPLVQEGCGISKEYTGDQGRFLPPRHKSGIPPQMSDMSGGPPAPSDYDPRALFPFGLSPIPEVPSELASEVSSVYSYYGDGDDDDDDDDDDDEDDDDADDDDDDEVEDNRSRNSIMYSGSCSSVKSNRTLEESDEENEHQLHQDPSQAQPVKQQLMHSVSVASLPLGGAAGHDGDEADPANADEDYENEHYQSRVMTVTHQRAFHHYSGAEPDQAASGISQPSVQDWTLSSLSESDCPQMPQASMAACSPMQVSAGAETASQIFRHLQATTDKREMTNELAKILNVLHDTLQDESSGSDDSSASSSSDDQEQSVIRLAAAVMTPQSSNSSHDGGDARAAATSEAPLPSAPPQVAPLGKPPLHPNAGPRATRILGPEIEERIRDLTAFKPGGRSGKEEMHILSKILVTLLCSCKTAAASQELKKIIRHFKEAASEAVDEFGDHDIGADDRCSSSLGDRPHLRHRRRRRRRRSNNSSQGSEADSQTNTLTPCNTDSKSSDDECGAAVAKVEPVASVSSRMRFNVIVVDHPPEVKIAEPMSGPDQQNVSFTVSLPRRSSVELVSGATAEPEDGQVGEWEWDEDDDVAGTWSSMAPGHSHAHDSTDSGGSITTRKLLTDMEFGAYNSDSLCSPVTGFQSGQSDDSPAGMESRPESTNRSEFPKCGAPGPSKCGISTCSSSANLFTHLEETFKVLNGAYQIITGAAATPEPGPAASTRSFEEVLQDVSTECANLEKEITRSSCSSRPVSVEPQCGDTDWPHQNAGLSEGPSSHALEPAPKPSATPRPASRPGSRSGSRLRGTKTPMGSAQEYEDGEWEWEYYYEEEEEDELNRLAATGSTSNTAPTTRATSPFPPAAVQHRADQLYSPGVVWERLDLDLSLAPALGSDPVPRMLQTAKETVHAVDQDSTVLAASVALAAEYLGQPVTQLASALLADFLQDNEDSHDASGPAAAAVHRRKKKKKPTSKKFLPKVGVKELVNRLEPKLFQDSASGTKMVMNQMAATSAIQMAKLNRASVREVKVQPPDAVAQQRDPDWPQSIAPEKVAACDLSVVTMRRCPAKGPSAIHQCNAGGSRSKASHSRHSPDDGSEAYGTGSTTSMADASYLLDDDDADLLAVSNHHAGTAGADGAGPASGSGQGVKCSGANQPHSRHSRLFRLLQDSDYTDSETESASGRISLKGVDDLIGSWRSVQAGKESDMESLCSVERKHSFKSVNSDCESMTSSGRGIEQSPAVARVRPKVLVMSSKDEAACLCNCGDAGPSSDSKPAPVSRWLSNNHSPSRGSPIRNSPKLELELMELVHLPSAPTCTFRNLPRHNNKL